MVVILIVLLAAGGYYAATMGGMQHGNTTAQSDKADKSGSSQDTKTAMSNNQTGSVTKNDQQASKSQQNPGADQNGQSKENQQGNMPVIIQVPVQTPQTDPRIYVEQLKERLKAINEANSSIASKSGGHTMVVQPNGSVDSSGQSNMNDLHQEFYELGQNVESMQESLSKLSVEINNNQLPAQTGSNNTYPYYGTQNVPPNYYQYPYNPYQPYQGQTIPGQINPQQNQPGQNQNNSQTNQDSGNMNNMSGMTNMNGMTDMNGSQTNHNLSITGMLNANTLKTVFSLMLLGSIILAIIAIVGFIGSLFKTKEAPNTINNQSVM